MATRLPVVAIESIPYIYRRAAFPLRATPKTVPRVEASSSVVIMVQQQNCVRLISPSCASFRLGIR